MPSILRRTPNASMLLWLGAMLAAGLPQWVDAHAPISEAATVAAGSAHSCALTISGDVKCWGANFAGQLGDTTTTAQSVAVDVLGLSSGVQAIALGSNHSCAITATGGVSCWGSNVEGQLGDGSELSKSSPVPVIGLEGGIIAISAGFYHTCALTIEGVVKCWGDGYSGQLGEAAVGGGSLTPVELRGLGGRAIAIQAGGNHNCAIIEGGEVRCWGDNRYGQLGNGSTSNSPTPVTVAGSVTEAAQISMGNYHSCARSSAGAVACWGWNHRGQLGDGSNANRSVATTVSGLGRAEMIAAGGAHTCALTGHGAMQCWGLNDAGQLGDKTTSDHLTPVNVQGLETGIALIEAGSGHTCVVAEDGAILCWGNNEDGQLGDNTMGRVRLKAVDVANLTESVDELSLSQGHSCARTSGGDALCWGQNSEGQLGDGAPKPTQLTAVRVQGLAGSASDIAVGGTHSCAVAQTGAACWGGNDSGELGDGSTEGHSIANAVTGLGAGVSKIAAGTWHSCAILTTGSIKCWGLNTHGQLGNGLSEDSKVPVNATGLSGPAVEVDAGETHTCALIAGGRVQCWGSDTLADGSLSSGVSSIASGDRHNCALIAGGVKCWGQNHSGQLGNGSSFSESTPVDVVGLPSSIQAIAAGGSHSCALTNAGAVYCWGGNEFGQLGDGTLEYRLAPVLVAGLEAGVNAIAAGREHSCAVMDSGGVKCWGQNGDGQLGDGTSVIRPFPAQVLQNTGDGLSAPGAPLIGSATAGNATATVSFSAPSSDGGSAITSYTAKSAPSGFTGQCTRSPCTVSGLSNGVSYTFTVRASNSAGTGAASSPSNSVVPKAPQSIDMAPVADLSVGSTTTLTASGGGSGNPVVFSSRTASTCSVSGDMLTALAIGECVVAANQAGSNSHLPAQEVSQTLSVIAAADAPMAIGDFYALPRDRPTTIPASAGVLINDEFGNRTLTRVELIPEGLPQHGTLNLSVDGGFTYSPFAGYQGSDNFVYRICMGGACSTAFALLQIVPPLSEDDQYIWMVPPGGNIHQQGFIRLTNRSNTNGTISISGIAASGGRSMGTVTLALDPGKSIHINSQDIQFGNADKGLVGSLGDGSGNWTLVVRSELDVDVLAYIRTPDGFVTSMHDRVEGDGADWLVPIFNPASNLNQVSRLRIVNTSLAAVDVQISGIDDAGQSGQQAVTTTLPPLASREYDAADLESGNIRKGLLGQLGDGEGKWRLTVSATDRITVQSLLMDPMGYLTNLSTFSNDTVGNDHVLWMVTPSDQTQQQGFLRLTNLSNRNGTVTLWGVDDRGRRSPGTATLTLAAEESKHLNSQDLEYGNANKGLTGGIGDGEGNWRIFLSSDLDLLPLGLIRTPNGFVTAMHDLVAGNERSWRVPMFNPGSNPNQVSVLRVVNPGDMPVNINVYGVDDAGRPGQGGAASFKLAAKAAVEYTAQELENGNSARGLFGQLGDGEGKWWLQVEADADVRVISMLRDPNGYLTNLSHETRSGATQLDP